MMTPDSGGSWIIFGGAFDPVHLGHLHIAKQMRAARNADGVLFLPSYIPPHKPNGCYCSFDDRVEMLRLALKDDTNSYVSLSEATRTDENYSLNSVRALKKEYPKCEFSFLVGTDNLALLKTWYKPDELLDEVQILVGSRSDENDEAPTQIHDERIIVVETSLLNVSSTRIRKLIAKGATFDEIKSLVPAEVAEYILSKGLYQ